MAADERYLLKAQNTPLYSWYWRAFCACGLAALCIFLPFQILDGGFFHYAGDFNSQQITFYRYLNLLVKEGASYAWSADLGSGVINAYSFYLVGSPFFWLSLIFPANWLPYLMCPLLALKFAVAGGGAVLYLHRYVKNPNLALVGACMYSLSGFGIYNIFFNHFVDVVALFPYLLWALDEAVYNRRRGLFAFFAALNLINNYFFFAGQIVFLIIYFVCKCASGEYKLTKKLFGVLAVESLLAAAMGCVIAWPAVLSLAQNPRTVDLASGWGFLTYAKPQQYLAILFSWVLPPDCPYIPSVWTEGITKWTSMTAYLPLCSLAGVIAYWKHTKGGSTKAILLTCGIFALVPALNSAFYAMNASYYARWYYMPVLIMVLATLRALEDVSIDLDEGYKPTLAVMLAAAAFLVTPVYDKTEETWSFGVAANPELLCMVMAFGIGGLVLFWWLCDACRGKPGFARRLLAAVLAFMCVFSIAHIGVGKFGQWDNDSDLSDQYLGALELKALLPAGDYRVDTYGCHDNLAVWLDKSGMLYFGSTVTPSIMEFYPELGVTRDVRSQPGHNLYGLRGLMGARYIIVDKKDQQAFETEEKMPGFVLTDIATDQFLVYENENWAGIGFAYDSYITAEQFKDTIKASRGNLLMRAILLDAAQIRQYGHLLTPLTDDEAYGFGAEAYAADCAARRAMACSEFVMEPTGFSAAITLEKENLVFFSVPYDEGFTATVNGAHAEVLKVNGGMMAVVCPAGESRIQFTYHTPGLAQSGAVALAGCGLYLVYLALFCRLRKKEAEGYEIVLKESTDE